MSKTVRFASIVTLLACTPAMAQMSTSNCMSMGPNMVHCDTMNMDSGSAGNAGDGGAGLGQGIAAIIKHNQRVKVGKLVAVGDCQGAVSYALQKGDFELAQNARNMCGASTPAPVAAAQTAAPTRPLSPYQQGHAAGLASLAGGNH